jgi:hypothetical protein
MMMKRFQYVFIALVLAYLLLTFFTPIDPATTARYGLSEFQVRLIGMSVSVPIALIWLVALYGYTRFQAYSELIRKEKEGKAFREITKGIMVLTLSLPATALLTSLLRRIAVDVPEVLQILPISRSVAPLMFQLFAFSLLASGSAMLLNTVKPKVSVVFPPSVVLGLIAIVSIFTYIITARPFGGSVYENYQMPEWLVVIAIVIPFLYAWQQGALAIYKIHLYRKHSVGVLYRRMLTSMVAGLSAIVASAILIQVFGSISQSLQRLNFTPLLIIVYGLILLYGVGYVLLARGARQLKKIEEV